jgi:alanine dehydrogenase
MLKRMEPGSVLVDISNDDPGAIESSHETHHDNPRYVVNGVVHYCVSNIPGAVAHSTSVALAAETLPMLLNIMNNGLTEACVRDGFIRRSLTAYKGYLTHEETSGIQGRPWIRPEDILNIADRIIVLAGGVVRGDGTKEQVMPSLMRTSNICTKLAENEGGMR